MQKNAKQMPKVYYGLHFTEGLAEYEEGRRLLIKADVMRAMDKTFQGLPVYVEHIDEVNLENIQNEADGYVVESFYNKHDGKHWCKFIVVSDKGRQAIENGWALSNAYNVNKTAGGGTWHNLKYDEEVLDASYDHLAIVQHPRYEETMIMTPEEFKQYNDDKDAEILKIANSKKGEGMFNLFKKEKVENSADYEQMAVELPKSKKEMTISQMVETCDKIESEKDLPKVANSKDKVKVGDQELSVAQLVEKYQNAVKKNEEYEEKMNSEDEEEKKENEDEEKKENEEKEKENEKDDSEENEDEEENEEEEKKNKKKNAKHYNDLKNAPYSSDVDGPVVDLTQHKLARGSERYGSK